MFHHTKRKDYDMKRIWIKYIVTCLLFMSVSLSINAQEFRQHWEKKVFAAYNLGGTSPLSLIHI